MQDNMGVPASPSGSQASPGAADASPPSVSIPNAGALQAKRLAKKLPEHERVLLEKLSRMQPFDWMHASSLHPGLVKSVIRKGLVTTWPFIDRSDTLLRASELGLACLRILDAQAIEARRAATAKTGAVEDESAVPKGCAQ